MNKDKKEKPNNIYLTKLYDMFSVAGLGCNREINNILLKYHDYIDGGKSYFFAEYICSQPIHKKIENELGTKCNDNIYVMAPFAARMVQDSLWIPAPLKNIGTKINELINEFNEREDQERNRNKKKLEVDLKTLMDSENVLMKNTELNISNLKLLLPYNESVFFKKINECVWNKTLNSETKRIEAINCFKKNSEYLDPQTSSIDIKFSYPISSNSMSNDKPINILEFLDFNIDLIDKYKDKSISHFIKDDGQRRVFNLSNKIIHYLLLKSRWGGSKNKGLTVIIPISSTYYLYGFLWIWLPIMDVQKHRNYINELYRDIAEYLSKVYAPILAIVFESFSEDKLKKDEYWLEEDKKIPGSIRDNHPIKLSLDNLLENTGEVKWYVPHILSEENTEELCANQFSSTDIDINLISLWNNRLCDPEWAVNSWFFHSYQIASRIMVDLIKNVIQISKNLCQIKTSLPSVLVIGGAGSGKDRIPELIRIFAQSYQKGKIYKINLAAIKPNAVIGPIVSGIEMGVNINNSKSHNIKMEGILLKIRNETINKLIESLNLNWTDFVTNVSSIFKGAKNKRIKERLLSNLLYKIKDDDILKESNIFPTIVFDELNSLDIDSQGVLLRFLENSEIIPTGGIADDKIAFEEIEHSFPNEKDQKDYLCPLTNCLVIGVMNEDPDAITREQALDFIREQKYLGGFINDLLYEHIMNIRRLRPDLKYRMARNGKITIPSLIERRSDIPILFYVFVDQEIKALKESSDKYDGNENRDFWVTFKAFDRLLSPEMSWRGNIRELQAVSKIVARIAFMFNKNNTDENFEIIIRKRFVDEAIKELHDSDDSHV